MATIRTRSNDLLFFPREKESGSEPPWTKTGGFRGVAPVLVQVLWDAVTPQNLRPAPSGFSVLRTPAALEPHSLFESGARVTESE